MLADLDAFLAAHGARPHEWGATDCSLVLADWAIANGHGDAAAHLRGSYDSEDACQAIVAAAGGVLPLVAGCAAALALPPLGEAVRGAIGVIGARAHPHRQWGAIFDGRDWQVRRLAGFEALKALPLAMWGI
jgi:hypothetical protein